MEKIAIIGAGISGLTTAQLLKDKYKVIVFEKEGTPGGLIRCRKVNGNLFHICGGHVFNSKRKDVLNWFWSFFDRDKEFIKAERNSVVFMEDGKMIPYPIENHIYMMDSEIQKRIIDDLLYINKSGKRDAKNFEEFLRYRFGEVLYDIYFRSYNEKIWRRNLKTVPLTWLEGKLPMPTVEEIIYNNVNHVKEKQFVHSQFWYEKEGGSQFIADRLSEGLNIKYNSYINHILYDNNYCKWIIDEISFDKVVFCGNIKQMINIINGINLVNYRTYVEALDYHGTTAVFCNIDSNPYSWIYQPSKFHESHRIICTGNFSPANSKGDKMTGTIEFTDEISKEDILNNLSRIPLSPKYLDHQYNPYTYPIQDSGTRELIKDLKSFLEPYGFYFTGRFADWEYYNMDIAIGASMDLCKKF